MYRTVQTFQAEECLISSATYRLLSLRNVVKMIGNMSRLLLPISWLIAGCLTLLISWFYLSVILSSLCDGLVQVIIK